MKLTWYAKRISRMSPPEIGMRGRDQLLKLLWRRRQVLAMAADRTPLPAAEARFTSALPPAIAASVPMPARDALVASAERLLEGHWRLFSREYSHIGAAPDWFDDPRTGRRAPDRQYCFQIDHRDEEQVGNVKYVWELSRHHHLTLLASAYFVTGDERYATRVAEHLASWWDRNPFLSGIHWTSGIEIGVRLMSWVWVRRLLSAWPGASELFERNPVFLRQLRHHQRYVATMHSHHSSANNHLIAEAAGLFAACCAFPFFPETRAWRAASARLLRRELVRQTFPSGLNRELATDYHGFVLELCLAAALEGEAADHPLGAECWLWLQRMTDALAAVVDVRLHPPRQGDSDDASGLLLDAPGYNRWAALLATGAVLFGRMDWWPPIDGRDVRTALWTALPRGPIASRDRPVRRPVLFQDAGMTILRDRSDTAEEIWCRCDDGPLGFLSLAAHGHADALSVEVRFGGAEILADPGTYCYHGDRRLRSYFRSTLGHNTLEIAGLDQSVQGGPFMWLRQARARCTQASGLVDGPRAVWQAEHDGYRRLSPPAIHRRTVELSRVARGLTISDQLECDGEHDCRLPFHLGPTVRCELVGHRATLRWPAREGERSAVLELPAALAWTAVQGQSDPPLGWYSPSFDDRRPSITLVGVGRAGHGRVLRSHLQFETQTFISNPCA